MELELSVGKTASGSLNHGLSLEVQIAACMSLVSKTPREQISSLLNRSHAKTQKALVDTYVLPSSQQCVG